jgi:RNA-directed DNA polymerase
VELTGKTLARFARQLTASVCARHGPARARCKSAGQVIAAPQARSRVKASTARWGLEAAPSTRAGRRTGTGDEGWDHPGRASTGRTRGRTIRPIMTERRQLRLGWRACCGVAEGRSPLRDRDTWIRRRLRSDHWKPWGRKRYRELRTRGVDRPLAWHTVTSAHGPWRLSQSPALAIALPPRSVAALGLPSLSAG